MIKPVKVSDLKHQITFTTVTSVSDGMGSFTETDVNYYTTWAAIWPKSAGEFMKADQISHEVTHRIRIRYPHGYTITSDMNIVSGSRTFEIVSIINPEEANVVLDFLAVEK